MANAAETVELAGTRRTQIPLAAVGAAAERVVGGAARRWKLSLVGAAAVGALAFASGSVANTSMQTTADAQGTAIRRPFQGEEGTVSAGRIGEVIFAVAALGLGAAGVAGGVRIAVQNLRKEEPVVPILTDVKPRYSR